MKDAVADLRTCYFKHSSTRRRDNEEEVLKIVKAELINGGYSE